MADPEELIAAVTQTRARLDAAQEQYDNAVIAALRGGVSMYRIRQALGMAGDSGIRSIIRKLGLEDDLLGNRRKPPPS